jgi:hypothetical protein
LLQHNTYGIKEEPDSSGIETSSFSELIAVKEEAQGDAKVSHGSVKMLPSSQSKVYSL